MKRTAILLMTVLMVIVCAFGVSACIDPNADNGHDYTVTVLCGEGGTYSLSEPSPVPENIDETLTVTPDQGYEINEVTYNGAKIVLTNENTYTFNVTEDATITISFKKKNTDDPPVEVKKYTISVTCGENGGFTIMRDDNDEVISDGADCEVEENTSVTLNVIPDVGYRIVNVIIDGKPVQPDEGTEDEYTFVVTKDTQIEIIFDEEVYYFTVDMKYECSETGMKYDQSMGTAKITPEKDQYASGETITLKVTPGEGYEIAFVTVNGEIAYVVDGTTDTFSIEVIEDLNIVVTFKTKTAIEIDEVWEGDWKFIDETMKLSLNAEGGTVTVDNVTEDVVSAQSTLDTLTLNTANSSYEFNWYVHASVEGIGERKIMTYSKDDETKLLIPDGSVTISQDLNGHWYNYIASGFDEENEDEFTINVETGEATFNNAPAYIVDCGYCDSFTNNDGSSVSIDHDSYFLVVNDELVYFIAWYRYSDDADQANGREFNDPTLVGGEYAFQTFINEIYIDPDLIGTWRNFTDPQINFEITKDSIKVGDKEVSVFNNGGKKGQGNYVRIDGVKYTLNADPGYPYYFTRETVPDLGIGIRDYFLKEDHDLQTIPEESTLLDTEWKSLSTSNKLTIGADGKTLTFQNKQYPNIYVCEKLDNGYYKIIAFSADNYKLEISYKPGESTIEASDGVTIEQYAKKLEEESGPVAGFLGLATGKYTSADSVLTVTIEADKMTIDVSSLYFDDDPIVVTQNMLQEADPAYGSNEQYQFSWNDKTNENSHTVKIYLNVTNFYMEPKAGELLIALSDYEEYIFDLPTPGTGGGAVTQGFLGLPVGILNNDEGKQVEIKSDSMVIKSKTFGWDDDDDIVITMDDLSKITPIDYYNTTEGYKYTFDCKTTETSKELQIYLNGSISDSNYKLCICDNGGTDYIFN